MKLKRLSVIVLIALTINVIYPLTYAERPNYVYDWEDILTDTEEEEVEALCLKVDLNITAEIVLITLKSYSEPLEVADIDEAGNKYFNDYPLDGVKGIGSGDTDRGVLLIFSKTEKGVHIEVGYGAEGDLTDAECGRILDKYFIPNYRDEKYKDAVVTSIGQIAFELGYGRTEPVIMPADGEDTGADLIIKVGLILIVGVVVVGAYYFVTTVTTNRRRRKKEEQEEKERKQNRYVDDRVNGLRSYLNAELKKLGKDVRALRPNPTISTECPHCNDKRIVERTKTEKKEIIQDNWFWNLVIFYLLCRTCGTKFQVENKTKVESIKGREKRLAIEAARRVKAAEEKRIRDEEARRRRRQRDEEDAVRRRRRSSSSSRRSSSSSSSSFGGGRSGGGGASRPL